MKQGPVPRQLNADEKKKLVLAQKVGLFYFQYTQLKQMVEQQSHLRIKAPRGHPAHHEGEPVEEQSES